MNSQSASSPDFTSSPRPSTMWVCGVIGYAQITSGRQSATALATAWEPSICSSMGFLRGAKELEGAARGDRVPLADAAREFRADRGAHRVDGDLARHRREAAEKRRIGQRAPDALQRELARGDRA